MSPEYWLVLTVAGGFLLLGVAGSPLAWAIFHLRRTQFEKLMELRWRELAREVHSLGDRLTQYEAVGPNDARPRGPIRSIAPTRRSAGRVAEDFDRAAKGAPRPLPPAALGESISLRVDSSHVSALIAVPSLEGTPNERDATVGGLKERYAAIWALADTGATADVIARATGQPMGQIELILGLRRQIDGNHTSVGHE